MNALRGRRFAIPMIVLCVFYFGYRGTRTAVTVFTIDNEDRALWPGS